MAKTYDELPIMPISDTSSEGVKTGSWRTYMPVIDLKKCVKCNNCWKFCPDVAIYIGEEGFPHVNYDYCKGCGICANECPTKAINMTRGDSE